MPSSKAERDSQAAEKAAVKKARAATGGVDGNIFVILGIIAISLVIIVWVSSLNSSDGFTDGTVPAEEGAEFGETPDFGQDDALAGEDALGDPAPELPTELDEFEQDLPIGEEPADDPETADETAPD